MKEVYKVALTIFCDVACQTLSHRFFKETFPRDIIDSFYLFLRFYCGANLTNYAYSTDLTITENLLGHNPLSK